MVLSIDIGTMCFMSLDCCIVASETHFDLNVLYHSRYLYVMCCMCVDNDDCKC
jgi:hypothetical protein